MLTWHGQYLMLLLLLSHLSVVLLHWLLHICSQSHLKAILYEQPQQEEHAATAVLRLELCEQPYTCKPSHARIG
jgi:hypothetical protein